MAYLRALDLSSAKERDMPRLIVITETEGERENAVVHDERVLATNLANEHASAQLIERVGWALEDAEQLESEQRGS
jgi:hypothetical protein